MKVRDLINSPRSNLDPLRTSALSPTPEHRAALYHRHRQANSMLRPNPSVPPSRAPSPSNGNKQRPSRRASIVLIGMPGVGKTTLAAITAKALGWEMLDTNTIFEAQQGTTIAEFVAARGHEALRTLEAGILADVLQNNPAEKVIACGAGAIELEQNRVLLKKFRETGLVIHILREKDAVAAYMRDSGLPYQDPEDWEQMAALYRDCCSFEFASLTVLTALEEDVSMERGDPNELLVVLKPVEQDFFKLLRFIHGVDTNKVPSNPRGHRTYFLTLTFEDINQAIPYLEDMSVGLDLWGIRADLLASYDHNYLSFQVATLRRHSPLPILFMIRTKLQSGKYPDINSNNAALVDSLTSYLKHALRLGIEYIELELEYPNSVIESVVATKGNSSIIGSFYDWRNQYHWDDPETRNIYEGIVNMGANVAFMVLQAKSFEDNMGLRTFAASVENGTIPLISINLGIEGKISRALNHYLSPVSHPLLPRPPSSGHITFQECQSILYLTGLLPSKKYYVFGHPIPHSMSPILYNAAFTTLGLPHVYTKVDTPDLEEIRKVMGSPDFGGASVTLPHAQNIIPLLQHLSRHAQIIGAVNIIFPVSWGGCGFFGDNTDWRGIKNCLLRSLTPAHTVTSATTALVLGAGGSARATIYALYRIGVINIFVYNRSRSKAETVADDFQRLDHLLRITALDDLSSPLPIDPPPTIIVSTIPSFAGSIDSTTAEPVDVGLQLEHLSPSGGVAMELAYEKRLTILLALAEQRRSQGSQWVGVEGIEVLLEQGYEACKIWTGRRAPVKQVRAKVLEVYNDMLGGSRR